MQSKVLVVLTVVAFALSCVGPLLERVIYVMHKGVIKAAGTPEEIRQSDEIREAYLGI